ncbi:MAG: hypothetical protein LBP50_10750, partial [Tannerella sp.]|nr:hypothetical protein [Tannerella sp.]
GAFDFAPRAFLSLFVLPADSEVYRFSAFFFGKFEDVWSTGSQDAAAQGADVGRIGASGVKTE